MAENYNNNSTPNNENIFGTQMSLQNHFRMYQILRYSLDKTFGVGKNVYIPF